MDHDLSPKGWLLGPWRLGRFCFVVSCDDLYFGFYWGRNDRTLYFCPIPMLAFGVRLSSQAIDQAIVDRNACIAELEGLLREQHEQILEEMEPDEEMCELGQRIAKVLRSHDVG